MEENNQELQAQVPEQVLSDEAALQPEAPEAEIRAAIEKALYEISES